MENINNVTIKDFPHICRICLSNVNVKPFEQSQDLLKLFQDITNIQIEFDVNLPKNVCKVCIDQLQNISRFINVSKNTDTTLKQIVSENKSEFFAEVNLDLDESDDQDFHQFSDELDSDIKIKSEHNIDMKFETVLASNQIEQDRKLTRHSTKSQSSNCSACGKYFATKNKLLEHQRQNFNCRTKKFKCTECEKAFFTKFKLKLHMRSHTKETPFECNICLKKFRHSSNLKRHDDTVHKGLKPFKCDVCGKEFATFLRRTEHLRIHTGERPYICAYCGISFTKYSTRYAHELRHKVKNGEIPKSDKKPKKYTRRKPDDPSELECTLCNKMFSSKQALTVHMQIHLGEKSFLCTVCGKGFLRKSHLEVHIRIHTGEKPYECGNCGKHFRQAACYRNHLLIHKGERSYKCDICQRTFIQLGHLQTHIKTHTGEKPYNCTFCGKSFAQNGNLKAHTRIHTGERPYQCSICYMGFYDSTSMKKHKKSHGKMEESDSNFISSQ